ncbi:MAG TPA: tetratricopeptide repeat protein [Candidatus Eisenbacteria bacterium]|uniref:Tetratricopeptide repeat protein n=1 Tax=Eiseniibacteriota bacterium TaxID=2212470 RepID=A0A7V2F410_UNCEI|nr:tetratricopeptide repeat protein [Candidatus Eisenbacteria bacterium]
MIRNPFRRPHLDDDQLSRFIDGTCMERERIAIAKHLAACGRCFEYYREAVLYKGLWVSGALDLESSKESIDLARAAPDRRPGRFSSFTAGHIRTITAAAAAVIIVSFGISYHFMNRGEFPGLDQQRIAPIQEAVELASSKGPFVIPGGERSLGASTDAYRSGYVRINDSLRSALAYFSGEFQEDETSRAVVYWLLGGYIATGQVRAARDLASEAIKEFPEDTDMMLFDAIVSYMEGEIRSSERVFRQVLESDPDNPYANLNLAVLLSERGEATEALRLLGRVADEHAESPFAARAKQVETEILRRSGSLHD